MVIQRNFTPNVTRIPGSQNVNSDKAVTRTPGSFDNILREKVQQQSGLKFSKHAELRLQSRNISLTQQQKSKINEAVQKAGEKGVEDSLILLDDVALVVSVKNRTVVTALTKEEMKENVFTNIDGAVVI